MRLGLVGRGPQAQRYLMPKNGGDYITAQVSGRAHYEAEAFLSNVDGVIVACHPAGHEFWCLEAFKRGLPVLCEKPLTLDLESTERILDAAEGRLLVAHTRLWEGVTHIPDHVVVTYTKGRHDYSPWLDWGPHALAMLADNGIEPNRRDVCMYESGDPGIQIGGASPMWLMVRDFVNGKRDDMKTTRSIYRALFAGETNAAR